MFGVVCLSGLAREGRADILLFSSVTKDGKRPAGSWKHHRRNPTLRDPTLLNHPWNTSRALWSASPTTPKTLDTPLADSRWQGTVIWSPSLDAFLLSLRDRRCGSAVTGANIPSTGPNFRWCVPRKRN